MKKNKKNKIFLYAGAILATLLFICISAATSNPINKETGGCNRIYDVNRDGIINFQDAGLCWTYITNPEIHCEFGDLLYDVNMDGQVNFQDCGLIWVNRD